MSDFAHLDKAAVPAWKKAQEEVKKCFNAKMAVDKTFWAKDFADTYAARGNIIKEQPSDFYALWQGTFFIVEVKSSHQSRFPLKDVRPSQLAAALRATNAGGYSRFVLQKLPEKQWYTYNGLNMYLAVKAGLSSLAWSDMKPITLEVVNFLLKE